MSTTTAASAPVDDGCTPHRRVRHEVRDAVAVMLFSGAMSCLLALGLTILVRSGS